MTEKFENALETAQNNTRPRKTTKHTYRKIWKGFTEWCEAEGYEHLPPSVETIGEYFRYLEDNGRRAGTIKMAFAAFAWQIKCFTKVPDECRPESLQGFTLVDSLMEDAKDIRDNVISEMEQEEPKRARGITVENLVQIFRKDTKQRDYGTRQETREAARTRVKTNKVLFLIMFYTLLRASEAINLRWEDIKTKTDGSGILHIRKNKISGRRKTRNRPISAECIEALSVIRPKDGYNPEDYVFSERHENGKLKSICVRTISKRLKNAAKHAGRGSLCGTITYITVPVSSRVVLTTRTKEKPPACIKRTGGFSLTYRVSLLCFYQYRYRLAAAIGSCAY